MAANGVAPEPEEQQIDDTRPPRSIECVDRVYVRFINRTNRCIEIVWINYRGAYERYSLLRRMTHYVDVNTFVSHPWVALDQQTKDLMRIAGMPIYYPRQVWTDRSHEEPHIRYPIHPEDRRQIRYITLPMYSLRERCLFEIRNHLRGEADVDELHLPGNVSADLRRLIAHRDNMRAAPMLQVQPQARLE